MSSELPRRTVREGQAHKRAAILTAAGELFVSAGVERTSMDAVAAQASVSKRTVYDYYGDKRRLLLGVIEDAGESALSTLRRAIEKYLSDAAPVRSTAELQQVLTDFAVEIGASLFASFNYVAAVKLIAENQTMLPELDNHPLEVAHTRALAERMAHFANLGLLDTEDPELAADHFAALTTLRILNEPARKRADPDHVRQIMIDGVRAFIRAYAPRTDPAG